MEDSIASRLLPILEPLQVQIAHQHYRVVPSTTNADDDALRAVPLPQDWQWGSLERHLKRFNPETVILQVPAFWQIEPLVHQVLRRIEVPVCIIEPTNYPLDTAAIRFASANAVIAEATEAAVMLERLTANNMQLPMYWVLIHAIDSSDWNTPAKLRRRDVRVVEEVHLVPGVPLFIRCEHLTSKGSGLLHRSDVFVWNSDISNPAISTYLPLPFLLKDFQLPFRLEERGTCTCGEKLFAVSRPPVNKELASSSGV